MEKKRILVTVKTYPTPAAKYTETVCTAGITEDGEWIRIYPIRYRMLDHDKQYSKFDWIEVEVEKRPGLKSIHHPFRFTIIFLIKVKESVVPFILMNLQDRKSFRIE